MNLDYYKTFYYVALSKNFTKAGGGAWMPAICEKQQRGIVDTDWRTTISVCVSSHE